ncbi:MAG: hypothetical protein MJ071_00575 [Oscillospiraceae bacterium]|nr:hypothetical protein [Oscillospiraceae bacterium]
MNGNDFMEAMNSINESYLREATHYIPHAKENHRVMRWVIGIAATAAAIALPVVWQNQVKTESPAAMSGKEPDILEMNCPFPDFSESAVRVTTAAYAPYLLEVNRSEIHSLSDRLLHVTWEKISPDTDYMGGETQLVFVENNGNPFKLVFYADGVVDYEYNGVAEKYKVSDESIHSMVYNIAHPENLENITDTLIWCAPECLTNEEVWKAHNSQHITVEPQCASAFGFAFELPDMLTYEVIQTDDEPTSTLLATIYPMGENTPIISIGFGVCRTGLETKSIDFNGCSATQGFYDGSEMWSFISLADDYEGCVILMQDEKLFHQYEADINTVLNTLKFKKFESERTLAELKTIYPEFSELEGEPFKGVEVYIWQMGENSYECGLMFGTNRNKTEEEILALSKKALSIGEAKRILRASGISQESVYVIPVRMMYSNYYYEIDEAYCEAVRAMFDQFIAEAG